MPVGILEIRTFEDEVGWEPFYWVGEEGREHQRCWCCARGRKEGNRLSFQGGERYTLSRKRVQRRIQSTPISYPLKTISSPHCELFYEKGCYWIKDLGSLHGTFVNGIQLYPSQKYQIKFEDVISLGGPYNEKMANHKLGRYLILKFKEVQQNCSGIRTGESDVDNACITHVHAAALNNELVLRHILQHLSLQDIKSCRFVNKRWNSVGIPILKQRSRVRLCSSFEKGDKDRNSRYLEEMKSFKHPSVYLRMLYILTVHRKYASPAKRLKLKDGLPPLHEENHWFFTKYLTGVRHLVYSVTIERQWELDLFYDVLRNLAPNLETLDIQFSYNIKELCPNDFSPLKTINFSKLEHLRVNYSCERIWERENHVCAKPNFANSILVSVPNLKSIEVCESVVPIYLEPITKSKQMLPKLEDIKITGASIDLSNFQILSSMPQRLRKLELPRYPDLGLFQNWMNKICSSLVEFKFELPDTGPDSKVTINMGRFPHLRKLDIISRAYHYAQYHVHFNGSTGGKISYKDQFPVLQTFEIRVANNWQGPLIPTKWVELFNSFFPQKSKQICKTVRVLELPHPDTLKLKQAEEVTKKSPGRKTNKSSTLFIQYEHLPQMFPSATNPFMKMFRNSEK